ncbi:hypothetical protein ACIP10_29515 [Streptomyces galbus]|uniref:hypothetical protein n=1 Tax=Streptomyces galbus TaxID=33898 RepID=UPI00379BBC4C
MAYVLVLMTAAAAVLAFPLTVLVRRERRRAPLHPEAHRIEAVAARGLRESRRLAHSRHHFADVDGVGALRDRDAPSR